MLRERYVLYNVSEGDFLKANFRGKLRSKGHRWSYVGDDTPIE